MEQDAGDGCVEGHPAPARALLFWRSFAQCVDPVGTQDSIDAGDGTGQYVAGAAFTEGRARLQVLKGVSVGIQDDGFRALHHGYGTMCFGQCFRRVGRALKDFLQRSRREACHLHRVRGDDHRELQCDLVDELHQLRTGTQDIEAVCVDQQKREFPSPLRPRFCGGLRTLRCQTVL